MFVFFFSSRRRHTSSVSAFLLNRSSDLRRISGMALLILALLQRIFLMSSDAASGVVDIFHGIDKAVADTWNNFWKDEIGRASCRGRVWGSEVRIVVEER